MRRTESSGSMVTRTTALIRRLHFDEIVSLHMIHAIAPVAENIGRVVNIRPAERVSVFITGESGEGITVHVEWDFFLQT
jgi:hypothetical protein